MSLGMMEMLDKLLCIRLSNPPLQPRQTLPTPLPLTSVLSRNEVDKWTREVDVWSGEVDASLFAKNAVHIEHASLAECKRLAAQLISKALAQARADPAHQAQAFNFPDIAVRVARHVLESGATKEASHTAPVPVPCPDSASDTATAYVSDFDFTPTLRESHGVDDGSPTSDFGSESFYTSSSESGGSSSFGTRSSCSSPVPSTSSDSSSISELVPSLTPSHASSDDESVTRDFPCCKSSSSAQETSFDLVKAEDLSSRLRAVDSPILPWLRMYDWPRPSPIFRSSPSPSPSSSSSPIHSRVYEKLNELTADDESCAKEEWAAVEAAEETEDKEEDGADMYDWSAPSMTTMARDMDKEGKVEEEEEEEEEEWHPAPAPSPPTAIATAGAWLVVGAAEEDAEDGDYLVVSAGPAGGEEE